MKKSILSFISALAFVLVSFSAIAQNGNDQNLIGKARGAAHECITPYLSQGIAVDAQVETTGICFVSGELKKVSFYTTIRCNSEPCPRPYSVLVATVYFDCEGNISSVECAK